jgi:dTDP-4-dehydrorhamnose reductase
MSQGLLDRILLTGADGQVGEELQQTLAPLGVVSSLTRAKLDLAQPEQIRACLEQLQPTLIVNAAAYTAVDKAELEPELAQSVNGAAPILMAQWAEANAAALLHISTDYVFNGGKGSPYQINDPTDPLGAYGATKLAGEVGIRQHCSRHWIVRTAWVYGVQGKGNFVKTMLRLGAQRSELSVVADQVGTPTWSKDLALALTGLLQISGSQPSESGSSESDYGTYHFTNSGVTSWYDFAIAIFEEATALGFPLQIERVIPITTADYPTPARRPAYSVLDNRRLATRLGEPAPHWRQALRQMLKELRLQETSL